MDQDNARFAALASLNPQEYLDDYETSQFPVKEHQVYPIPFVTDAQTPLPARGPKSPDFLARKTSTPDLPSKGAPRDLSHRRIHISKMVLSIVKIGPSHETRTAH